MLERERRNIAVVHVIGVDEITANLTATVDTQDTGSTGTGNVDGNKGAGQRNEW